MKYPIHKIKSINIKNPSIINKRYETINDPLSYAHLRNLSPDKKNTINSATFDAAAISARNNKKINTLLH